jgi:hypothetical protein
MTTQSDMPTSTKAPAGKPAGARAKHGQPKKTSDSV